MRLFNSNSAVIDYFESSGLIKTTWKDCNNAEDFMSVIKQVMAFYETLMPRKTLWNHTNFGLHITEPLQEWTENNINIPAYRLNTFEKISFVISKDTMSQMSVMEIFDESACGFIPRYFVDEQESMEWLNKPLKKRKIVSTEPPQIIIDRQADKIKLSVEVESEEFDRYLHLFNKLWQARILSVDVAQRYLSLTPRERTILKLLVKGKSNDLISDQLHISPDTVKTHRKNIYRKLECSRIEDLMKYSLVI